MSLRHWFLEHRLNHTRERIAALETELETLSSLRVTATQDFEMGVTIVHDKPLGLSMRVWRRIADRRGKLAALRVREVWLKHAMTGSYPESPESKARRGYNPPPTERIEPPDPALPPPSTLSEGLVCKGGVNGPPIGPKPAGRPGSQGSPPPLSIPQAATLLPEAAEDRAHELRRLGEYIAEEVKWHIGDILTPHPAPPPGTYICPICHVDYKHKYGSCKCGARGPSGHPGNPGAPTPSQNHPADTPKGYRDMMFLSNLTDRACHNVLPMGMGLIAFENWLRGLYPEYYVPLDKLRKLAKTDHE